MFRQLTERFQSTVMQQRKPPAARKNRIQYGFRLQLLRRRTNMPTT